MELAVCSCSHGSVMQRFAGNVAKMPYLGQEDHVCSRDFAPQQVQLAWEPPRQSSQPGVLISVGGRGGEVGCSNFELDWCGTVPVVQHQRTDQVNGSDAANAGIHTGKPHGILSPQEISSPLRVNDGHGDFSQAEENQPADSAGYPVINGAPLSACETGNRPGSRYTPDVAKLDSPPTSLPSCSALDTFSHSCSRPVRVRKPPKTFISEMEDMHDAGACKRKRRAKNDVGEVDGGSAEPAQVVLEDGLERYANGGLETVVGPKSAPAEARKVMDTSPDDSVVRLTISSTSVEDISSPADDFQFRGRLTRSMKSKSDNPDPTSSDACRQKENNLAENADDHEDAEQCGSQTATIRRHGNRQDEITDSPKMANAGTSKRRYKRKWRNQYGSSDPDPRTSSSQASPVISGTQDTSATEVPISELDVGDFVWGKMRGFDWWPASVVSAVRANQPSTAPGHVWVCWFGDNQFSQILQSRVRSLTEFRQYLLTRKPKALYRKAVMECIESAALRAGKQFPFEWLSQGSNGNLSPADESLLDNFCSTPRQRHLLQWSLSGFLPEGFEGLRPSELDVTSATTAPNPAAHPILPASPDGPLSPPYSASPGGLSPTPVTPKSHHSAGGIKTLTNSVMVSPRQPQQMVQSDVRGSSGQQVEKFITFRQGKQQLNEICLCCGAFGAHVKREHPLFMGGICEACIPSFVECAYCFDEDGSQTYCCICADGKEVYLCDSPGCARSYCPLCIEKLCGAEIHRHINKLDSWMCFMCNDQASDLLLVRNDWHSRLLTLMSSEDSGLFQPEVIPPPPSPEDRQPIRVLALFDGIGTGMLVLNELGIEVASYVSSEIDVDAIRVSRRHHTSILHVGGIEEVTSQRMLEWGPFDLVIGGSPCNDLSMANPARRGIFEGSGRLFFDFFRLLQLARPAPSENQPFFWLFENVVSMRAVDKSTISRFLECNPSVVDAKDVSPAHRPRYFWGNLPGMTRGIVPWPGDVLTLQECVEPNCERRAKFEKLRTITTKTNSIRQTKQNLHPVAVLRRALDGSVESEDGDMLWCTEMERIFGFPAHYTDVGNMGRVARQRLLGRAWSTPVIRHLLAPLRDYFKTTGKQLLVPLK